MADRHQPPSDRSSSREHVARIDRGYFKRASPFQVTRRWLIVAGLAASVAWCGWAVLDASLHVSPGHVHAVHAKWERDCAACHVPFTPITTDAWLSTAATQRIVDAKCEGCHRGPVHHPLQVTSEAGSCASCHADHRGRTADISRVPDRTCTACHADIAAHRLADPAIQPSPTATSVTAFDEQHHPPFASLRSDPGHLKFSHGRHMRAGLSFAETTPAAGPARSGERAGPWTYAMLSVADRRRYQPRAAQEQDLVQLDCGSCHEFAPTLGAGDARTVRGRLAAAEPGAYALPVQFERHCAACHDLPFEGLTGGPEGPQTPPSRSAAVLPHGLDATALARAIESHALKSVLDADPRVLEEPPPRPLPTTSPAAADAAAVRSLLHDTVDAAVNFTRGTCGKCHDVRDVALPEAAGLVSDVGPERPRWFETVPTSVPDVWLPSARFNHRAHQSYGCRECHPAAYGDDSATPSVGSPLDNPLVMIAGRDSCIACHAPAGSDPHTGGPKGGARFDCVECHGYHGLGPHPAVAAEVLADQSAARRGAPAP